MKDVYTVKNDNTKDPGIHDPVKELVLLVTFEVPCVSPSSASSLHLQSSMNYSVCVMNFDFLIPLFFFIVLLHTSVATNKILFIYMSLTFMVMKL